MTTQTTTQSSSKQIGTLYVGDLHPDVTEGLLFNEFSAIGSVLSIRICRDMVTKRSLGYAYVNYQDPADAKTAMENMNFENIQGRPIRIMWSNRDPSIRKSGKGNVFIKNLNKSIETKQLNDTFVAYGNILSCKIVLDDNGASKGYGFIHFDTEEAANNAIENVNGMLLMDKKVYVGKFLSKQDRNSGDSIQKFTNCFVKNFPEDMDTAKLQEMFAKFGEITSAQVMEDAAGKSKGFGFVCFKDPQNADEAVKEMHNSKVGDKTLYVSRAQKKQERQQELRLKFEKQKIERTNTYMQGVNLYVKQLDDDVDDNALRDLFQRFGTITSAKVMRDNNGRSKNFGFVCFSSPSEATCAISEMNAKIHKSKPLYVTIAQRKEERKSRLSTQYLQRMSQQRPNNIQNAAQYVPNMQATAAAAPTQLQNMILQQQLGQQRYYMHNRAPAAALMGAGRWPQGIQFNQQQATANQFQRQLNPNGMQVPYPTAAPTLYQTRQLNPNALQMQFNANNMTENGAKLAQMINNQQPNGIAGQRPTMANVVGQPGANPRPMAPNARMPGNAPTGETQKVQQQLEERPVQGSNLEQAQISKGLVESDPEKRRQWLGEMLYPRVAAIDATQAGRLTGMLLELDTAELLHMMENEDMFKTKIEEARIVMNNKHRNEEAVANDGKLEEATAKAK